MVVGLGFFVGFCLFTVAVFGLYCCFTDVIVCFDNCVLLRWIGGLVDMGVCLFWCDAYCLFVYC